MGFGFIFPFRERIFWGERGHIISCIGGDEAAAGIEHYERRDASDIESPVQDRFVGRSKGESGPGHACLFHVGEHGGFVPIRTGEDDFKLVGDFISEFDQFWGEIAAGTAPVGREVNADKLVFKRRRIHGGAVRVDEAVPEEFLQVEHCGVCGLRNTGLRLFVGDVRISGACACCLRPLAGAVFSN